MGAQSLPVDIMEVDVWGREEAGWKLPALRKGCEWQNSMSA